MYLAPGSPFANERAAPPEVEHALRARYGVPDNATVFFTIYVERLVVEGTLGPSIKVQGRSVEDLLLPALPVSLALGAYLSAQAQPSPRARPSQAPPSRKYVFSQS